jgi:hypothetical protein
MKLCVAVLGLAAMVPTYSSSQEINTIEACRAYREAWFTSTADDVKRLPVTQLVHRAEQMMTCAKEIDTKPVSANMTADDAAKALIANSGYPILAVVYYQEAYNRAAWFIDSKHLTQEFVTVARKTK